MEPSEPYSSLININYDGQENDEWDEGEEEIELGSDEHDLFLKDDYVKSNNDQVLPFRASSNRNSYGDQIKTRNQSQHVNNLTYRDTNNPNDSMTKIEPFIVDDSGRGSPTSSSIVYQTPNFEQFAGNLAPSSPRSVLISLIIVIVILSVTIVPKLLPQAFNEADDTFDELEFDKNGSIAQPQVVHSDVRCKCVCPPFPNTNQSDTSAAGTIQRRLYVGNTSPHQCNCINIVQPHFKTDTHILLKDFCVSCDCRYQSRNTTTIRRSVIFFIAVLTGLALYMLVQYLLKYFKITRRNLPPNLRWLSHQMTEGN